MKKANASQESQKSLFNILDFASQHALEESQSDQLNEFSQKSLQALRDFSQESPQSIYGFSQESPLSIHGFSQESPQSIHGFSQESTQSQIDFSQKSILDPLLESQEEEEDESSESQQIGTQDILVSFPGYRSSQKATALTHVSKNSMLCFLCVANEKSQNLHSMFLRDIDISDTPLIISTSTFCSRDDGVSGSYAVKSFTNQTTDGIIYAFIEPGHQLGAFATVRIIDKILEINVICSERGSKLGEQLFHHIVYLCKLWNILFIKLNAVPDAVDTYIGWGFVIDAGDSIRGLTDMTYIVDIIPETNYKDLDEYITDIQPKSIIRQWYEFMGVSSADDIQKRISASSLIGILTPEIVKQLKPRFDYPSAHTTTNSVFRLPETSIKVTKQPQWPTSKTKAFRGSKLGKTHKTKAAQKMKGKIRAATQKRKVIDTSSDDSDDNFDDNNLEHRQPDPWANPWDDDDDASPALKKRKSPTKKTAGGKQKKHNKSKKTKIKKTKSQ